MSEVDIEQLQREILANFRSLNVERIESEMQTKTACDANITEAKAIQVANQKQAKAELDQAVIICDNQLNAVQLTSQQLVDAALQQARHDTQQLRFRNLGQCLDCGEPLNLLDRIQRRTECFACREYSAYRLTGNYHLRDAKSLRYMDEHSARRRRYSYVDLPGWYVGQTKHEPVSVEQARQEQQQMLSEANKQHAEMVAKAKTACEQRLTEISQEYEQQVASYKDGLADTLAMIAFHYQEDFQTLQKQTHIVNTRCGLLGAVWQEDVWRNWNPRDIHVGPMLCRIGTAKANSSWDSIDFVALVSSSKPLLLKVEPHVRDRAILGVQAIILRRLGLTQPGKLRFLFIDPVSLGQNVAPFMHLVDYDDALVTARAWTEPQHIEQRLADITEHMENVIQKYLRNRYANIEEYNAHAGEVAEPYRVLVVHDFPANFSESAVHRLVSVLQSGPRCGVYAIVHVDPTRPLPHGFNLGDLERNATVITQKEGKFVWNDAWPNADENFATCELTLDSPPSAELFNHIVNTVGQAAKDAARVEVPFARIIPSPNAWWQASALESLSVPLGPSGANRFQTLEIGRGTAQHALVAGKTGSGKSTLLHALITNLAMTYSPDEVELYLIDFKKGVEFKSYATHTLPHARVVAIESEREFCLSVLQGLDAELKRRGDLFRASQVDNLAAYRQKTKQTMPRVLLLVDEFQEFFTEDDAIASQASQLLDRLVRQGRAFGMHVLLGSQTLAGSYSLARSTIDQMAVRIALQCSEADSRLILADDNGAARLLTRPGEAIYNDANGMVEGNSFFQVAYLNDDEREVYLARIAEYAYDKGYRPSRAQIVFEGNAPAVVNKNQPLADLLARVKPPLSTRRVAAWLGEPIAIKDPTAAYFRRQSGSNLLIVGQNDESALGMTVTAVISLAAQYAQDAAIFYILDFGAVDHPHAERLRDLTHLIPHKIQWGRRRELTKFMSDLATELDVRQAVDEDQLGSLPSVYLFVYGLHRARDLRLEDTFGLPSYNFNNDDEVTPTISPAQQFQNIVQQGPDLGIHTVVWCDTVANLYRMIDRRLQREFETRVAFQMSTDDSANLIDTPAAAKLGLYRALLVSEEEGRMEKFRPYDLPDTAWLETIHGQLAHHSGVV